MTPHCSRSTGRTPLAPAPYTIAAGLTQPTAEQLRADSVVGGGLLTETGDLPAEVVDLATSITASATTPFDKAKALNSYFTDPANGFTYSLNVPVGNSGDALVDFLTLKQGYCEQYASAMGIMLRAVGVPARVAIGFTQGTQTADGNYLISSNDAHAWVEVPFVSSGWVQFDPTPLDGSQGGQQGFTDTGEAAPSTSVSISAIPTQGTGDDVPSEEPVPQAGPTAGTAATGTAADEPVIPTGLWWVLGFLALVVAASSGPTLVRRRRRQHRLAIADAGGPGAAAAAWREIEDLAVDHGVGLNPAESARSTANRLAKAAHLTERGRLELRAVVAGAELGWYSGGSDAQTPTDDGGQAQTGVKRQRPWNVEHPGWARRRGRWRWNLITVSRCRRWIGWCRGRCGRPGGGTEHAETAAPTWVPRSGNPLGPTALSPTALGPTALVRRSADGTALPSGCPATDSTSMRTCRRPWPPGRSAGR